MLRYLPVLCSNDHLDKSEFVDFCVLDHNSFTMYAPVSTCRAQEISVECFIPKTGTVLREKTCGDIEILSPTEGIHIAFFDAQLFAAYDRAMHHGRADALAPVLFPGADRFDQRRSDSLIDIDEAVGADIALLRCFFVCNYALEAVGIQRGLFPADIGIH